MLDPIETWLATGPDLTTDPIPSMRAAGLIVPAPDYGTIARRKAALFERTGLFGIASVWGGPQLVFRHFLSFGNDAQREEWSGRPLAVAISEPQVGAHPKLLNTRAEPVGGGFRITGQKAWVSNGPSADAIIVFAITAEQAGRKRYSAFIVPRGTPGLTTADMPGLHALRPSRHCLLTFDGCLVPASAMLGEPGSAYDRMALPFRDIEDAVSTFCKLTAFRLALGHLARMPFGPQAAEVGAIVGLTAVFAAGAEAVLGSLDTGSFRTGDATLVGLLVLAGDITERSRQMATVLGAPGLPDLLADLDAALSIARGPRLARQTRLAEALVSSRRDQAPLDQVLGDRPKASTA